LEWDCAILLCPLCPLVMTTSSPLLYLLYLASSRGSLTTFAFPFPSRTHFLEHCFFCFTPPSPLDGNGSTPRLSCSLLDLSCHPFRFSVLVLKEALSTFSRTRLPFFSQPCEAVFPRSPSRPPERPPSYKIRLCFSPPLVIVVRVIFHIPDRPILDEGVSLQPPSSFLLQFLIFFAPLTVLPPNPLFRFQSQPFFHVVRPFFSKCGIKCVLLVDSLVCFNVLWLGHFKSGFSSLRN